MLPLNSNQVPALFNKALGLARSGKAAEALAVFTQLETLAPNRAEIPFHKAQLHQRLSQNDKALSAYQKAARLAPNEASVWRAYAGFLSSHGDNRSRKTALKALQKSKLPPRDRKTITLLIKGDASSTSRQSGTASPAEIDALLAKVNSGHMQRAEKDARALLARGPNEVLSTIHAAALAALGQNEEADAAFKQALAIDPDYGEALAQYGQFLLSQTRRTEARKILEHAQTLIPKNPIVLGNLGKLYVEIYAPREALACLDPLLDLAPENPLALFLRAEAHLILEDAEKTIADLDVLEAKTAPTGETLALRARALKLLGKIDAANSTIAKALDIDPSNLRTITIAADLHQQSGDFEAAEEVLREALARDVRSGAIYRMIAQGRKLDPTDPVVTEMKDLWLRDDLPKEARVDLGYGLVKLSEEAKEHEATWEYLSRANEIMAELYPNDGLKAQRDFDRFKGFLEGFDPDRIGQTGCQDNNTIFVTGLPRSGTTLVEQILASHSMVTGGDELGVFHPLGFEQVAKVAAAGGKVSDMPDSQIENLGRTYNEVLKTRFPDAQRVTDKSISTYQIAPLVWLALPKAKIVALRRDPRDNLWSIFKNRFVPGLHRYSYSQEALVDTYRIYTEYLELWREMAADRLYEISYEALVADPETETRKLLEFCELEWEDACLEFHKTKREVKTLSVAQVRQPLYNSSLGKWRPYAKELAPMLEGLKGLEGVPED